jgi:uncharacterized membrane protein
MDRPTFDAFCHQHRLGAAAIDTALALSGQRPDAVAWHAFAVTALRAAGLAGVGAGVLFFVAANWQDYGVFGRFALLQGALLVAVAVTLWRPPPQRLGQAALLLAAMLAGALLALFGQSYQTGADVHELFFAWALLALPFALAAASGALWALWWGILNVALALLCGWLGPQHFVCQFVAGWGLDRSGLLMLPCVLNLVAAAAFVWLQRSRWHASAPPWLARMLAGLGILYGTAASVLVVAAWKRDDARGVGLAVVFAYTAISALTFFLTWQRRRDVYPIALLAASWIAISTVWLGRLITLRDLGTFFLLSLWLIGASTAAGMQLMRWRRRWQADARPLAAEIAS